MTALKQIMILIIIFMIPTFQGVGQTKLTVADVKLIESSYQLCLDKGANMLGCSVEYYYNINSCLSDAYDNLIKHLNAPQKAALEKEQNIWLKKRDRRFKAIDQKNRMEGRDGQMIRQSEKAHFVKARALDLIWRGHN